MSKEELLELTGDVIEKLPNAMFRVRLENGVEILAHTAGKMRKFRRRLQNSFYDFAPERFIGRSGKDHCLVR